MVMLAAFDSAVLEMYRKRCCNCTACDVASPFNRPRHPRPMRAGAVAASTPQRQYRFLIVKDRTNHSDNVIEASVPYET